MSAIDAVDGSRSLEDHHLRGGGMTAPIDMDSTPSLASGAGGGTKPGN